MTLSDLWPVTSAEIIAKASWYVLETAGRVAAMDFHREVRLYRH